nr:MAG TPA: hypothetical protein [Caudoviricetes sp.]DAK36915.1 MAG TPA: hypothetical protein [Caudoviricetes sp.]DAU33881.1 MAG TPA: hypothetical protein [Caudoviricetes sp.]
MASYILNVNNKRAFTVVTSITAFTSLRVCYICNKFLCATFRPALRCIRHISFSFHKFL